MHEAMDACKHGWDTQARAQVEPRFHNRHLAHCLAKQYTLHMLTSQSHNALISGRGRGVVATEDISAGTLILAVPPVAYLTALNAPRPSGWVFVRYLRLSIHSRIVNSYHTPACPLLCTCQRVLVQVHVLIHTQPQHVTYINTDACHCIPTNTNGKTMVPAQTKLHVPLPGECTHPHAATPYTTNTHCREALVDEIIEQGLWDRYWMQVSSSQSLAHLVWLWCLGAYKQFMSRLCQIDLHCASCFTKCKREGTWLQRTQHTRLTRTTYIHYTYTAFLVGKSPYIHVTVIYGVCIRFRPTQTISCFARQGYLSDAPIGYVRHTMTYQHFHLTM